MSQITTGIRSILSFPLVYDTLQWIMGINSGQRSLVAVTGHFKTSHLGSPKNQPPQNVESKEHFFSNKLHISR